MNRKLMIKKLGMYILGLFLYALGIGITAKTNLGIMPVSTLPYALSFILPFSFGICTFFLTVIYILIQKILLKNDFETRQYLQIVVGVLFSFFVDFSMFLIKNLELQKYSEKLAFLILGCFIVAIGITLSVVADVIIPPAEGAINAISIKTGLKFGNVKILFDSAITMLAIIVSLIFIGHLEGFKEGTIISIFVTGIFTKILMKYLSKKLHLFIETSK